MNSKLQQHINEVMDLLTRCEERLHQPYKPKDTFDGILVKSERIEYMKAILEFNLEDPDDRISHLRCVRALDMACVLFEIRNIPNKIKHREEVSVGEVLDLIYDCMEDLNLDELIT
jgi:hypothetical protein